MELSILRVAKKANDVENFALSSNERGYSEVEQVK
jgi:hypothetical protein